MRRSIRQTQDRPVVPRFAVPEVFCAFDAHKPGRRSWRGYSHDEPVEDGTWPTVSASASA